MLTEIKMSNVASFKNATSLATDKRINLIYGLNGTGKSTFSNFLYNSSDIRFANCKLVPEQSSPVMVYNQKFIQDNFFISDNLKGIFSLSKENKEANERIKSEQEKKKVTTKKIESANSEVQNIIQTLEKQKQKALAEVWNIKNDFHGGDRVLENFLTGLIGSKERLYSHLKGIAKPNTEPERSVKVIRDEVSVLNQDDAQIQSKLSPLIFNAKKIESEAIFSKSILGNTDTEVAELIEKLGNSDWVKQGLVFLPTEQNGHIENCPFCQEKTITSKFISSINEYFNDTYQSQIADLEQHKEKYSDAFNNLSTVNIFTDNKFSHEHKELLLSRYQILTETIRSNLTKIEQKLKSPNTPIYLNPTTNPLNDFNKIIEEINFSIEKYNYRLSNRNNALDALKEDFWLNMRFKYDQTISRFDSDEKDASKKISDLNAAINALNEEISKSNIEIASAQKLTVNIDDAVKSIEAGLLDLGIDNFTIVKHSTGLYRVVRSGESEHTFHTLSEGEKMMISFLYFCELCKGKSDIEDSHTQKIVVIDDPISSLSHIFAFNVGQLIRSVFFQNDRFSQVFVLTHSLYFFYELTDPNHDRRKLNQKLFRITKSASNSVIQEMKYEEIQNDYQSYWSVINDRNQPPALIANCMRNIVEYFFNFVRKKDLNNVFGLPEFKSTRLQAFYRYINRESHSLGQNIIDMKEFDYDMFKEGLKLLFEKAGYIDHYNAMNKI